MELEIYKRAEEIKRDLYELLKLRSFCCNDSAYLIIRKLSCSNQWEELRLPLSIKKYTLDYIKDVVDSKIKELDQQFIEL